MRSYRLQAQCTRALRSALQTTPRTRPSHNLVRAAPTQAFHSAPRTLQKSSVPASSSPEEEGRKNTPSTRANFSELDVLGNTPTPATAIDVCTYDGFELNSGVNIRGGDGILLVNGEAFSWRPWEITGEKRLLNAKGQVEIPREAFGVLEVLWPRPDLLIIGFGAHTMPLSPATRKVAADLGLKVDLMDTRNAQSAFNMLATERGVENVAGALIPLGWEEGVGCVE